MNVAICLSGQPRTYTEGYKYIKKFLIEEYGVEDVFIHFWWDNSTNLQGHLPGWNISEIGLGGAQYESKEDNLLDSLNNLYNPKKIEFESPQPNLDLFPLDMTKWNRQINDLNFDFKDIPEEYQTFLYNHFKSVFYSQYKVNQLKNEYLKETGKSYDIIIRTRFDFAFLPYNLEEYNSLKYNGFSKIFPSKEELENIYNSNPDFCMGFFDNLWIYSNKNHDKMIQGLWNDFDRIFEEVTKSFPDNEMKYSYSSAPWMSNKMIYRANLESMQLYHAEELGLFPNFESLQTTPQFMKIPRTLERYKLHNPFWFN